MKRLRKSTQGGHRFTGLIVNTNLTVEYRDVSSLSARERNPRKHSAKQLGLLQKSIEQFGFNARDLGW